MNEGTVLQLITTGGSTGILLVVLWFLWQEYKTQAAYIRDRLDKSDAERKVLAQELGLSTQQLNLRAQAIMDRDKGSSP